MFLSLLIALAGCKMYAKKVFNERESKNSKVGLRPL